ncbi:hypothetical protein, partial [Streptomyces sp. NPDC058953]
AGTRGRAADPYDAPAVPGRQARRPDAERDADAVRARMASMQRGWQRGRRENADDADDDTAVRTTATSRPAPRTTSEGNGP